MSCRSSTAIASTRRKPHAHEYIIQSVSLSLSLLTFGTFCLLGSSARSAGQPIIPVAVTDQLPPGVGPDTGFLLFGYGSALNDAGQVAFNATLVGVGINMTNDVGLFQGAPGTLELVAREGSPAPGPGGKIYLGLFSPLGLSDSNTIVFRDYRGYDLGSSSLALYYGQPGAIELLAENGDIIPGAPGPITELDAAGFSVFNGTVPINDSNRTVFGATFEGDTYRSIVVGAPGSISVAVEPGMQAPGLPNGVTFSYLNTATLSLNSEDRLAFEASLFDSSTQTYTESLFAGLPSSLALLARTGDQAAGTDPGVFYEIFSGSVPRINGSGVVTFGAYLTGLGVRDSNSNALWVGVPGALELVARGDMQAPGVEPGVTYAVFTPGGIASPFSALINSSGEIAFAQYLSTGEQAIWAGPPDNLRLVARQGQSAPGLDPGETFNGGSDYTFLDLDINDPGSVAFQAVIHFISGSLPDSATYVGNPNGELVYVTRYGDPVTLDDGQDLSFSSMALDGFNSEGQALIHSSLSDGSDGLFLADTATTVITSSTTASGNVGVMFNYQTTASNSPTSFSASMPLPGGLSFNATTGLLSGTPTVAGTFDVTLSATNSEGQGPSTTLSITITSKPPPTPTPTPSPSPSPSASPSPSVSPSPSASPSPSPSVSPSPSPSVSPSPSPSPMPVPVQLGNISTRLSVGTADNVLIGGFIVTGTVAKQVIVRAIGPSLPLGGTLADPILELHDDIGTIASNDNWQHASGKQAIIDSGFAPQNDNESAILMTLDPGAYTAIVRGVGDTTGVALVEVYDLDQTVDSKLANISTRGFVQTGDNVMIGGLIVLGNSPAKTIVRAIGPSLPLAGALSDPTLELHNGDGATLASNDNWKSDQEDEIDVTGLAPKNDAESAIVLTVDPGAYTAIVRGANETTGIALVEAYQLDN